MLRIWLLPALTSGATVVTTGLALTTTLSEHVAPSTSSTIRNSEMTIVATSAELLTETAAKPFSFFSRPFCDFHNESNTTFLNSSYLHVNFSSI